MIDRADTVAHFCAAHLRWLKEQSEKYDLTPHELMLSLLLACGDTISMTDRKTCRQELKDVIRAEMPRIVDEAMMHGESSIDSHPHTLH
jgi:hypothetical protein